MAENSPPAFEVYIDWLHDKSLSTDVGGDRNYARTEITMLLDAYILGDMIGDDCFYDAAMDTLIRVGQDHNRFLNSDQIKLIYESCGQGSMLRKLAVDQWERTLKEFWESKVVGTLSKDFFTEMTRSLIATRGDAKHFKHDREPWMLDPCAYHLHRKSGSACFSTKTVQAEGLLAAESQDGGKQAKKRKRVS